MANEKQITRLREIFESTLESGLKYDDKYKNVDYYSLFCKAASNDKLYKIAGNNLCIFNCLYEDFDSVMMIFFIPINSNDSGAKNIAERVMEVVEIVENCFITLDYLMSEEVKEDKFVYVIAIKKINQEEV